MHERCVHNKTIGNSCEWFGCSNKTDRRLTPPGYKIDVTRVTDNTISDFSLGIPCVCKMLLCIESVLTDCKCAASETNTIAGLQYNMQWLSGS